MNKKLEEIEVYLSKLGMKTDKVPSFSDLKTSFRKKLDQHPDKAGAESTKDFQEITEASRIVFLFLVQNPDLLDQRKSDVLKYFEKSNKVVYHDGGLLFHFDDDQYEGWKEAFENKVGPSKPMSGKNNFMFQQEGTEGKVTVSLYFQPSGDGRSKIMLQGKGHMPFMAFVIPDILKEIRNKGADVVKSIEDKSPSDDVEKTAKVTKKTDKKDEVVEERDVSALVEGFDRMQAALVKLSFDLVQKVDTSSKELSTLQEQVGRVLEYQEKNAKELSTLQEQVGRVIEYQEKIKPVDTDSLDRFLNDSQTVFTKLEDVTTIWMAAGDVDKVLENITKAANTLKDEASRREIDINAAVEKTVKALPVFINIEKKIDTLVDAVEAFKQPSVRPKEAQKVETSAPEKIPVVIVEKKDEDEIIEVKLRKGLFLTSSIGLKLDMYDLQEKLDSEVAVVRTYHVEKDHGAKDPELNLKENLQRIKPESDIDFLIIATGSNDLTKLEVDRHDMSHLTNAACDQAKALVQLAHEASKKHNIDVFVVEKPPRGDSNGKYSQLNVSSNGLYPSLIAQFEKVHYIPLPSLNNLPEKSQKNLTTDGVHLKPWGLKLLRNDIVKGVKSVYKDIIIDEHKVEERFQKDGKRKPSLEDAKKRVQVDGDQSDGLEMNKKRPFNNQPSGSSDHFQNSRSGDSRYQHTEERQYQQRNYRQRGGEDQYWNGGNKQNEGPYVPRGWKEFSQEQFYPKNRYGRDHTFHKAGNERPNDRHGFQGHTDGWRGQQSSSSHQEYNQRNPARQNGQTGRNNHGQQDGQMPEMVKQYLLKTLMGEEKMRYRS